MVTPQLIKELRDKTGVGVGKCKEALEQANGNLDEAISLLRKAGVASAVKKEGRSANEGMIATAQTDDVLAVVEVNAETDFAVKNARFQEFLQTIADEVAITQPASLEDFQSQKLSKDPTLTVEELRSSIVQAIGENIQIRRLQTFSKSGNQTVGVYSHLGGKIVTCVVIEGSGDQETLAKDIAMHIAAAHPEYVDPEDVPKRIIDEEKEIAKSQLQGKPDYVIDKILEGKLAKFFDEVCLTRQHFIKDDKMTIGELVSKHEKDLKIKSFMRWTVGKE